MDYIKKFEKLKGFAAPCQVSMEQAAGEWVGNGADILTVKAHEERMALREEAYARSAENKAGVVFGKRKVRS